jgi:hypothetical protein
MLQVGATGIQEEQKQEQEEEEEEEEEEEKCANDSCISITI